MRVTAQVSVYPLRQPHLGPAVEDVRRALESAGLDPQVGPMSTFVRGDAERIFAALREAFESAASTGQVAMVFTVSNACPADERGSGAVGGL